MHSKDIAYKNKENTNNNYGKFKNLEDDRKGNKQKYPTSILNFSKPHPSIAKHRTEKSIACLKWLIKTYSNENDIVLDNCMGSFTTAVACHQTQRNFIGFELDKTYFDKGKERLQKVKNQISMFDLAR